MQRKYWLYIVTGVIGLIAGYLVFLYRPSQTVSTLVPVESRQIIGYLPYWLLTTAEHKDYSPYMTTLAYFDLTLDSTGRIQKLSNPQEEEPGWHTLHTQNLENYLKTAKSKGIKLSLVVFSGDPENIEQMIQNPKESAQHTMKDVAPLMKQYGFSDLNLDIEDVLPASDSARQNFSIYVSTIKQIVQQKKLGTLTIDVSPDDLIHHKLVSVSDIEKNVDYLVVMGYDYHYIGSFVTGAVAPLSGAGIDAEYDVETAINKALDVVPPKKVILGAPLYGYSWETLATSPKSAVIPGTGLTMSSSHTAAFLQNCATCSAKLDTQAEEAYVVYKDQETGTYHQIFFPDQRSMEAKVELSRQMHLGGMAVWALGYEDNTILAPLRGYKARTIYLF